MLRVLGICAFALMGSVYANAQQARTYDFGPSDPHRASWVTQAGRSLDPAIVHGAASERALGVPVSFPDGAQVWLDAPVSLAWDDPFDEQPATVYTRLEYRVYVPPEVTGRLESALLLKDKDGLWYEARSPIPLKPGEWSRVAVDLSDASVDLVPRGHTARWSLYRLSTMDRIGFAFWADESYEGHLYLDAVTMRPAEPVRGRPQLSIVNLRMPPRQVDQYGCLRTSFQVNRHLLNPFNQHEIAADAVFQAPSGDTITVPAFFTHDYERVDAEPADRYLPTGPGRFEVRFTPREAGVYRWHIEVHYQGVFDQDAAVEQAVTPAYTFTAIPRDHPGFVRVSPEDPRFFAFEDGSAFFPIGHNFRSPTDLRDWKQVLRQRDPGAPEPVDRGLDIYEEYLPRMAAAGENLIEVWMSSWWLGLEWTDAWKGYHGLGRYSTRNADRLDRLLELCARHGIYVQVVIDNHGKASQGDRKGTDKPTGQVDHEWEFSPYNRANGGFLDRPVQLFADDPRVAHHYRNRLRYIAGRWGYATNILGFEMWSELDLIGSKHGRHRDVYATPAVRNWHERMIRYLNAQDHGGHLVTTHYSGDYSFIDPRMVRMPEIDYIVCDAYHAPNRPLVDLLVATDRFAHRYRKPYMITEFGGNWNASSWPQLEADLHAGLWTSWMTSAAGTALYWWFEHIDRADLYFHYQALAAYAAGEDRRRGPQEPDLRPWTVSLAGVNVPPPSVASNHSEVRGRRPPRSPRGRRGDRPAPEGLGVLSRGDGHVVYVWIYDRAAMMRMPPEDRRPEHTEVPISISGLRAEAVDIEAWNTWTGKVMKRVRVETADGTATWELPTFHTDIALKVRAAPPSEPPPPAAPDSDQTE